MSVKERFIVVRQLDLGNGVWFNASEHQDIDSAMLSLKRAGRGVVVDPRCMDIKEDCTGAALRELYEEREFERKPEVR